jgi:hypothetical protein
MRALRLTLFAAFLAAGALLSGSASSALAADCEVAVFDSGGYVYDFSANTGTYSALLEGGSNGPQGTPPGPVLEGDSWDAWGSPFVYAPGADLSNPGVGDVYSGGREACEIRMGGREVAFPVAEMHGLQAHRRWYVDDGPLIGARSLTVLHNPSAFPISVTVADGDPSGGGNLGSDSDTEARATSDGTGAFSPASSWGVTSGSTPVGGVLLDTELALAHVWDGARGAMRVSEVVLGGVNAKDALYWDWKASVPAGATVAFISYEIQAGVASQMTAEEVALAAAQAEARLRQPPASLYAGMSATEIAGTLNWPHPTPTASVAAVQNANAASPVRLDGGGSTEASGLAQCAINGYAWQTDDGTSGSGPVISHLFAPGPHSATLTVTNNCGGARSAKTSFEVAPGIKLGKVKLNRRRGTATLRVNALGPGSLTLSGKGLRRKVTHLTNAGTVSLTLRPTGRARRALAKRGKAKVRAAVSLLPPGGETASACKAVVLRRVR